MLIKPIPVLSGAYHSHKTAHVLLRNVTFDTLKQVRGNEIEQRESHMTFWKGKCKIDSS